MTTARLVSYSVGLLEVKVNPLLDPLRSDPRFADLLRRMNLQPSAIAPPGIEFHSPRWPSITCNRVAVLLHFADAERVEKATYKPLLVLSD